MFKRILDLIAEQLSKLLSNFKIYQFEFVNFTIELRKWRFSDLIYLVP